MLIAYFTLQIHQTEVTSFLSSVVFHVYFQSFKNPSGNNKLGFYHGAWLPDAVLFNVT